MAHIDPITIPLTVDLTELQAAVDAISSIRSAAEHVEAMAADAGEEPGEAYCGVVEETVEVDPATDDELRARELRHQLAAINAAGDAINERIGVLRAELEMLDVRRYALHRELNELIGTARSDWAHWQNL